MPNANVRANAQAMPIDRRAALGSLAVAGAMLAAPRIAKAASPDAELFALVRKAKALDAELTEATNALIAAERANPLPLCPDALYVTKDDCGLFTREKLCVGLPFTEKEIEYVRLKSAAALEVLDILDWKLSDFPSLSRDMIVRAKEIDSVAVEHFAAVRAVKDAAGISQALERVDGLNDELCRTWRAIAFLPAQTREGVLAKLEAVAKELHDGSLNPEEFSDTIDPQDVAWMAAADLAAIQAEEIAKHS